MQNISHSESGSANTTRTRSPALWQNCPIMDILAGTVDGTWDGDDFLWHSGEDAEDTSYMRYIDTGNTIRNLAVNTTALATGSRGGVLRLSIDASDNDAPVIQRQSGNGAGPYLIGNTSGAAWPMWFEARIRKSSITDNQCAFAVGLAQVGRPADNGLLEDDTGDIVDSISFIGFRAKHDNGEELDFVYQDGGQTAPVEVMAAISDGTMVASTWIKLGFYYNPLAPTGEKIAIFVNNKKQATFVTNTNIDAATFPENDALAFVFGAKNGEATATTADIDWWYCCQCYDFGA